MKNIAKWVKDNIFKPIIDAFKTAFGIHSPSTVMAEQGTHIISGLLKGLKDKIKDVLSWIAKLPGEFKEKLGNAREWLVGKGKRCNHRNQERLECSKENKLTGSCSKD